MRTFFVTLAVAAIFHTAAFAQTARPIKVTDASIILVLEGATILIDPVGDQRQFRPYGRPDIVILTRPDPRHVSVDTMIGLLRRDTVVLAPQAVIDRLPLMISNNVISPFDPGARQVVNGITFTARSASEGVPRDAQVYDRSRGDIGVVIESNGARLYF